MTITERLYQAYLSSHTVTTDSRAITPGCIFFAFRGEHFDGNAFAPQALEQGAALCVISDPQYKVDDRCIVVLEEAHHAGGGAVALAVSDNYGFVTFHSCWLCRGRFR